MKSADGCVCRTSADDFTMRMMDVRVCMMGMKCVQLVRSGARWWTVSSMMLSHR